MGVGVVGINNGTVGGGGVGIIMEGGLTILNFLTRFTQTEVFWKKKKKENTAYFLHNSAYSD